VEGREYTAYTPLENRTIARIFVEGERDKALLINCEESVRLLSMKDSVRLLQIAELRKQIDLLDTSYLNCFENSVELSNKNIKDKRKLRFAKIIIVVLGVLVVVK